MISSEIKLMLVDDHKLSLQAYSSLLQEEERYIIVGVAGNGKEAMNLLETIQPDIIILDCDMPVMSGSKALKLITGKYPAIKVIILTMHQGMGYSSQFLMAGARSFLNKGCDAEELFKTIDTVYKEGYHFSNHISKILISDTLEHIDFRESYRKLNLTPREADILKLICTEKSNAYIAEYLSITLNTVKSFRKILYKKTKTESIVGLIKYAIRNGLTSVV